MLPEQQVAAILDILLDNGSGIASHIREVPDVVHAACLQIAQPEEHAIVFNNLDGTDIPKVDVVTLRIVLVEPQPSRSFVVIAISNEFLGGGVLRQETRNFTANLSVSFDG